MKYYIVGISHFINIVKNFFNFVNDWYYLIIIIIVLIIIFLARLEFVHIIKSFIKLLKFPWVALATIITLIQFYIVFSFNSEFSIFEVIVNIIYFFILLKDVYNIKGFNIENNLFDYKYFKDIFTVYFILIITKFACWGESYIFNSNYIIKYLMYMLLVFMIQALVYFFMKVMYTYDEVRVRLLLSKSNYNKKLFILDFISILLFTKRRINIVLFREYVHKYGINNLNDRSRLLKMISCYNILIKKDNDCKGLYFIYEYIEWYIRCEQELIDMICCVEGGKIGTS